jgi:TonB family protein
LRALVCFAVTVLIGGCIGRESPQANSEPEVSSLSTSPQWPSGESTTACEAKNEDEAGPPSSVESDAPKWRSAIENYVVVVKAGHQSPLNGAKVAFARYINEVHERIHPVFSSFLASLDAMAPSDPINDLRLVARLEIVISRDGRIIQMGVVRSSGITAFDIGALDSVDRAQPFAAPPGAILSAELRLFAGDPSPAPGRRRGSGERTARLPACP